LREGDPVHGAGRFDELRGLRAQVEPVAVPHDEVDAPTLENVPQRRTSSLTRRTSSLTTSCSDALPPHAARTVTRASGRRACISLRSRASRIGGVPASEHCTSPAYTDRRRSGTWIGRVDVNFNDCRQLRFTSKPQYGYGARVVPSDLCLPRGRSRLALLHCGMFDETGSKNARRR
jgi:hypothetical protein